MKGNVLDLAVAVVIGAAFGKIVSSLVDNIITPFVGMVVGGVNFSALSFNVDDAVFTYGAFLQSVIDFLIVALVIFVLIKAVNKAQGAMSDDAKEEAEEKPAEPSEEVKLLREIRDSLQK